MKKVNSYYFSVEGENEQWYFEYLQKLIRAILEKEVVPHKRSAYKYKLGYSNFAFELWLILHKRICNFSVEDRSKYVQNINTLYGTDFTKLKDNKNKETFDKLLNQTTLENVKVAIRNSRKIRIYQEEIGNSMIEYKGFKYYKDNPDLTINECVEIIFSECGINFD